MFIIIIKILNTWVIELTLNNPPYKLISVLISVKLTCTLIIKQEKRININKREYKIDLSFFNAIELDNNKNKSEKINNFFSLVFLIKDLNFDQIIRSNSLYH